MYCYKTRFLPPSRHVNKTHFNIRLINHLEIGRFKVKGWVCPAPSPFLYAWTPNKIISIWRNQYSRILTTLCSYPRFSFLLGVDPEEPQAGLVCANQLLEKHCTTISRYSIGVKVMLEKFMTEQILCVSTVLSSQELTFNL